MREIDSILAVLRDLTNSKTDKELAVNLGITYGNLDNFKARDKIPVKRLYEFANKLGVSMDTIINGNKVTGNNNITLNGSNINLDEDTKLKSAKFKEFLELYKAYGNDDVMDKFISTLNKIKEFTKGL
ncbi:helix-turn-helix domain-containing protein [Campylobacter hyointestinalis]|uniref:helix-turn-helix domain-containing protein n=1 Tax=Campylobacter hyointestinalis TaxID=198 RepID=UPI00072C0456|nr:helix-turn-helix domain-containing protein [Campylobacter hyointestinalis]CUU72033.1 transcriptional regulator [Campylobacter hyointestinalis subsp. hyointestinalis]